MEQSILQKLQRVKIKDLLHILKFVLAFPVSLIFKLLYRDLWLICDNENEARDNGFWLYKYITESYPKQKAVYAINKKSPDYIRVKDLGRVVQYGSFMHWVYYLAASKNISSQKGGKPNAAICYVLEVYGILKNTRVFLQHGIIKDDMPFLHYKNTKMRLFVTSTKRECDYVSSVYGYPKGWVKKLGLCRLDNLHNIEVNKKQILIMPTWRNWIGLKTSKSYEYENIDKFSETAYFKAWNGLLNNSELVEFVSENNIEIVFYPHREMQKFIDEFKIGCKNIVIAAWPAYDVQELLKQSALLITDYSSIAMDFAYMKKPLIYYQFDYDMFREGHYPEGYFSYKEDGFGKICENEEEVVKELKDIIKRGYSVDKEYIRRNEEFFDIRDCNNCERNYQAIREL